MSTQQFRTAHNDCIECDDAVTAARAYLAAGGSLTGGRWSSSVRNALGLHWAEPITAPADAVPAPTEAPAKSDAVNSPSEDGHVVDVDGGDAEFEPTSFDASPELLRALLVEVRAIRRRVDELDGDAPRHHRGEALPSVVRGDQKEREIVLDRMWDQTFKDLQRVDVERESDARTSVADDEHVHDASPSAGESAEPGLASTASVEGEPAAGARNAEAPAATPAEQADEGSNGLAGGSSSALSEEIAPLLDVLAAAATSAARILRFHDDVEQESWRFLTQQDLAAIDRTYAISQAIADVRNKS